MEPAATETPGAADPAGAGVIPGKRQDVTGRRAGRARQTLGEGAAARGIAEILRRGEVGGRGGARAPELVERILVRRDHPGRIDPQPARDRRRQPLGLLGRFGVIGVPADRIDRCPARSRSRVAGDFSIPARRPRGRSSRAASAGETLRRTTRPVRAEARPPAPAASTARSRATRRASASTDRRLACSTRARSRPGPRPATGSRRPPASDPGAPGPCRGSGPALRYPPTGYRYAASSRCDGVKRRTRKLSLRVSGTPRDCRRHRPRLEARAPAPARTRAGYGSR